MVGPLYAEVVIRNVEIVLQHAREHNMSVLCCLSLPWQSGVQQVHWEVRTIERKPDGTVRDGERSYSYTSEDVRVCASTLETDVCDAEQTKKQVVAMAKHFSACNLDTFPDEINIDGESADSGDSGNQFQKLKAIVAAVQADRSRLISEMDAIREDKKKSLEEAEKEADRRLQSVAVETKNLEATMRKRVAETDTHNKTLLEHNLALGKAKAEAERAKAECELLQEQNLNEVKTRLATLEVTNRSLTEKMAVLQKNTQREREQLTRAHTKEVEDLERRMSGETVSRRSAERKVEDLIREREQLNEVCEQLRMERHSANIDSLSVRKATFAFKCALAVASAKHVDLRNKFERAESCSLELNQMLEQNEASARASDSKLASLEEQLKEAASARDDANTDANDARKKVVDLKKQLAEAKKAVAAVAAAKPVHATTKTEIGVNTEPQQEPEEVTQMRIEIPHLHDQKDELKRQVEELQHIAAQAQTAVQAAQAAQAAQTAQAAKAALQAAKVANAAPAATATNASQSDLTGAPCGDPAIEALVGQVQLSVKNLVDLARSGHVHKNAAEQMWTENQILKRCHSPHSGMSGVNAAGQWPVYGMY